MCFTNILFFSCFKIVDVQDFLNRYTLKLFKKPFKNHYISEKKTKKENSIAACRTCHTQVKYSILSAYCAPQFPKINEWLSEVGTISA